MTDTPKVLDAVYVVVDDWDGLYIDGKLWGEGDSMSLRNELEGLTVHFTVRRHEADDSYVTNVGGFPDTYDELIDHQYMWEEDHRDD